MFYYSLFRFFEILFLALPSAVQKDFILGIAKFLFLIDAKHKKIIKANLDLTIKDEISPETYQRILKNCHKNLALVVLQVLRSSKMTLPQMEAIVNFENREIVDAALKEGKPIIFISAHYGNWELGATALSALITPTMSIHKKMNDTYFDEYLMKSRTKFNMSMTEKKGAIRHLLKALKQNMSLSMMIDQNVNPRDGIFVNFLGAKATQTSAPAFLARKFDLKIIPLFMNTTPEKEHVITFYEPIIVEKTDNEEADILKATQAQADLFSQVIKTYPEPWFWCHKRWKTAHEEIYR